MTIDPRARSALKELERYRPGMSIEEAKRQRRARGPVIKLASNENALGPSPRAVAAARRALGSVHRYPDALCAKLRFALSARLKVAPESILVGNGSDELLVLALRAFVDPGEDVVVARPTFLIYELQARAAGASVRTVPLNSYRYDLPAMKAAVTPHTKLVFIANPDNPTGTYVTARELNAFLSGLPGQTLVVMDEAYYEFVEARDYPQTARMIGERPVIVTRSFSKAYGLAGLRVGYAIARPEIIEALDAVREPFNVNAPAQAAALAALEDRRYLARSRALLAQGRRYLTAQLDRLRLRHVPSVTNFILIELGPRAAGVAAALLARGVIVREMSGWKLDGCIRVTLGTMAENRKFIQALQRCLT
ncbi:MAG TPA: histidinol-phosphate transaminase [bacterium]